MATATAYLNGAFVPLEEARLPVTDRGFMFGDGVYEMLAVYDGTVRRLQDHLSRLARSLAHIQLADPLSRDGWADLIRELIDRNGGGDLAVYLQVTRGPATRDHAFPEAAEPTVLGLAKPLDHRETQRLRQGVSAILMEDQRWARCEVKSVNLLPNVLARQQAREMGAHEALLQRDGEITEGAATNVFVVSDGLIMTPPLSRHILSGITRQLALELATEAGLPVAEQAVSVETISGADEIWITSTTREILPVVRIDGEPVDTGRPGPGFGRLIRAYDEYTAALRAERTRPAGTC